MCERWCWSCGQKVETHWVPGALREWAAFVAHLSKDGGPCPGSHLPIMPAEEGPR